MTKRRFFAYIYDICILTIILTLTYIIIPTTENSEKLDNELVELEQNYLEEEITDEQFINQYILIFHESEKETVIYSIINVIYVLIFFVIIPLKNNYMTLGQAKMGIKFGKKKGKLTANDLIYRSFIINGLLHLLINLSLVFFLPAFTFFVAAAFISFVQLILVIISVFMILYRKDKKGLQDIWTNTYVEEVK